MRVCRTTDPALVQYFRVFLGEAQYSTVRYRTVSTTIIFCLCRNIIRINNMVQEDDQFFDDAKLPSLPVVVETGEVEVVA